MLRAATLSVVIVGSLTLVATAEEAPPLPNNHKLDQTNSDTLPQATSHAIEHMRQQGAQHTDPAMQGYSANITQSDLKSGR